jgi:hypothetical protein
MKNLKRHLSATMLAVAIACVPWQAQASSQQATSIILPNIHAKSLTTPVGWGAAFGSVFVGVAGTDLAPYDNSSDWGTVFGVGLGNPVKNLGIQASIASLDMSQWNRYGLNLHLHRYIGDAQSIAIGVENIMLSKGSDAEESYYIVYSKGVLYKPLIDDETGTTRLHFSVGAGTGRFGNKSPLDRTSGKGKHGSYVFGNISYELFNEFNVITDWNGVNLNAGISKTFPITEQVPLVITVGAADLTHNSANGMHLIGSIGMGITL